MSLYERCPAATGIRVDYTVGCPTNGDGAHRCRRPDRHLSYRQGRPVPLPLPIDTSPADHVCACNFVWTSGESTRKQVERLNAEAASRPSVAGHSGPGPDEAHVPVPANVAGDFVGGTPVLSRQPTHSLTYGDHDLGQWYIVSIDARYDRQRGNHYVATLLRKD